jgi:nucleotidyltransferase/DNA polymerase involved in DNA repair
MIKRYPLLWLLSMCFLFLSCGSKKESPASIAKKWCELNARVTKAPDGGPEYGKAKAAREKFEEEMEKKYGSDKAFMDEIEKEVEKCEDASEGR